MDRWRRLCVRQWRYYSRKLATVVSNKYSFFFFLNAIFEMNETERKLGKLLFVLNGVNKYSFDINSNVAAFNFHCK